MRKILANVYSPYWWIETAVPHLQMQIIQHLSSLLYSPSRQPSNLMDEDWDNVIILDGCRYDLFLEANTLDGFLNYRISPVSSTQEFLAQNFEDKEYHDTVYVTANPMYRILELNDVFHHVVDVWDNHWNDEWGTVLPERMTEATVTAYWDYPDKRIISHFMQPHYPFIGELAEDLGEHSGYEYAYRKVTEGEASRDSPTVWERLKHDEVSRELVWKAYRENLEVALPHVRTLLELFDGKTVVTSDHGNLLGERPFPLSGPIYGHPAGVRCEHLCKVPWLVVESDMRKQIVEGEPSEQSVETSETVSERLADLGYVDVSE